MSRVYVLGNAGMDLSLGMARLPVPGETLVASTVARAPGGKGLNQAVVAARAGAEVVFAAPIGMDGDGAQIRLSLAPEPLTFEPLARDLVTDLSIVMVTPGGENSIATAGLAAEALSAADAAAFARRVGPHDWLLMQGNLSLGATRAAMEGCAGRVIFNTAPLRWPVDALLPLCGLVIANAVEAAEITATSGADAARRMLELGAHAAIVTLGRDGAICAAPGELKHLPASQVMAVDTTGAGDTLCGVIAACLARSDSLHRALQFGQRAAAVTVTKPGAYTALPSREELTLLAAREV